PFNLLPIHFFFQAEDGIRDFHVTGVQTCALPIFARLDLATRLNRSLEFLDPLLFGHAAPPACSVLLPSPTRGEGPGVRGTSAPNAPSTIAAYWRANSSGGIGPAGSYH